MIQSLKDAIGDKINDDGRPVKIVTKQKSTHGIFNFTRKGSKENSGGAEKQKSKKSKGGKHSDEPTSPNRKTKNVNGVLI